MQNCCMIRWVNNEHTDNDIQVHAFGLIEIGICHNCRSFMRLAIIAICIKTSIMHQICIIEQRTCLLSIQIYIWTCSYNMYPCYNGLCISYSMYINAYFPFLLLSISCIQSVSVESTPTELPTDDRLSPKKKKSRVKILVRCVIKNLF